MASHEAEQHLSLVDHHIADDVRLLYLCAHVCGVLPKYMDGLRRTFGRVHCRAFLYRPNGGGYWIGYASWISHLQVWLSKKSCC